MEEERRRGSSLPIDSLIALAALRAAKRLTVEELALHIQRDTIQSKRTLEGLVEAGLVQSHGNTPRTRSFMLAPILYGAAPANKAAYARQVGLSALQHEQMVLSLVRQHGRVRRSDVTALCKLNGEQAKLLLQRLKTSGQLKQLGSRGGAYYVLADAE